MATALVVMEGSIEHSKANSDERESETDPARFETVDNEALSSLLMLAKANPHLQVTPSEKEVSREFWIVHGEYSGFSYDCLLGF